MAKSRSSLAAHQAMGKAVAQRLAAEGAQAVITDNRSKLGEVTAAEYGLVFLYHDVCDEATGLKSWKRRKGAAATSTSSSTTQASLDHRTQLIRSRRG